MFTQSTHESAQPSPFGGITAIPQRVDALGTVVVFRADREIFGAGDPAEYWYKVLGGSVRTFKLLADGRRQILEFLLPGDVFGFDCLSEHFTSAEAITRTTLMRYPRRRIEALAETDSAIARSLREMVSQKLEAAQVRMLSLGRKSAQERIASFLLELSERQSAETAEIDLPMSRGDIADHLGLTLETVSRVLGRLKRDGAIALPTANHVCLRDRHSLETVEEEL